ncbi:hypothetical protein KD33_07775 [Clostridium sp. NCR]|nr:hypothetical protein KD33_07775 [Clostridium sp. NCR]
MAIEEKIVYGLDNIHVAKYDEATNTYATPVALEYAKACEVSYESNTTTFYGDNAPKYQINTMQPGEGTLTVGALSIAEKCLLSGAEHVGGYVQSSESKQPRFALLFRRNLASGGYIYNVVYDCKFQLGNMTSTTIEDSVEETVLEIPFTSIEKEIDGKKTAYYEVSTTDTEANADVVSGFFTEVQVPKKK